MEKPSEGSSSMSINDDQECNKANDDFWSRAPRGAYFVPTDEDLIEGYLYRKVNNLPFPSNIVNEADVYSVSPDQLISTGNYKQYEGRSEMYFFTSRERKYLKGNRPRRDAGDGRWVASGSKKIIQCGNGTEIGCKKVLVFHSGKDRRNKTDWVMHEYELSHKDVKNDETKFESTVLCKIYQNKKPDNAEAADEDEEPVVEKLNHPLMEVEAQMNVPAQDPMNLNNPENVEIPLNNDVASAPMYVEYSVNNFASAASNEMNFNNPVTNVALNQRMTSASPNPMELDNRATNVDLTLRMTSPAPNLLNLNNPPQVTNAALNQRMTSASPNPMELDNWGDNVDLTLRMTSAAPNRLNLNNPPPATIAALNQRMTSAAPNPMKLDNQVKIAAFILRMTSEAPTPMDLNNPPPVTIAAPNPMKLDNQVKNAALNLQMTSAAPNPMNLNNQVTNAALNRRMTSAAPNRVKDNVASDQNYFNCEVNNLTSSGMNLDNPVTNASSNPVSINSDESSDDDE